MPEKSPETITILTYSWVFILAIFGGVVSHLKKLKNGKKWKWIDFITEVLTAAFAGVITFYLCTLAEIPQVGIAALVGIAGNYSNKATTAFGDILDVFLNRFKQ